MATNEASQSPTVRTEMKTMKRKRSTLKGKFHRIYNRFRDLRSSEDYDILKDVLVDMEAAYKELEVGHANYIELLDPDDEVDSAEQLNSDMDMEKSYSELCDCRLLVKHRAEKSKASKESIQTVKVKKLDAPSFNGDIRQYPSFKRDYASIMIPSYGNDPFALKKCLSGEALKTVQGVDYDYNEMVKRLDLKYGRPEKIADSILSDIRKLNVIPDGDFSCFISTVEIIERCYLDLKRMKLEHEMNSATMINEIEKLLPCVQKREWILQKQKHKNHSTDFMPLMKFLVDEKTAMEYMTSELRNSSRTSEIYHTESEVNRHEHNLSTQMQQNQEMLQKVVEGLAHITEIVSHGNYSARSPRSHDGNTGQRKCWYHDSDSHDITNCWHFVKLDTNSRFDLAKRSGACFICLRVGHIAKKCTNRKACEQCGRMHHNLLHVDNVQGSSNSILNKFGNAGEVENVILMISEVTCKDNKLTTLWDPGSNISLITHSAAHKLNLSGQNVTLSITKVGNTLERVSSKEYIVPLLDKNGHVWQIRAFGIDEITANVTNIQVSNIITLFPGITASDIYRPRGEVHMLIGSDCCTLLPVKIKSNGNLQLMQNQFGYCLRGSHALLKISTKDNIEGVRINHLSGLASSEMNSLHIINTDTLKDSFDRFLDIESLGTYCSPRCGGCKCGKCSTGSGNYTLEEEKELHMIENGLTFDEQKKCWTVSYPWKRDPNDLPNNVKAAIGRLRSTEQRLKGMGSEYALEYQKQIQDMVDREVARRLSVQEMRSYKGPVHYIAHHEVLKPESQSTPVRIVFNSSASYMGHIINNYWAKGPKILNDLLSVLLRFRENHVAIVGDIAKMYNSVHLSPQDQQTHRFVWRDLEENRSPDHYVLTRVPFGDRPSGAIAILALQNTAKMSKEMFPHAADVVIRNSYVDDILASVESRESARDLAQDITNMLQRGGFLIKHWIISGQSVAHENEQRTQKINILDSEREKVLGLQWLPVEDVFTFKVQLDFSKKSSKGPVERKDLLSSHELPDTLTRRMVLSQVARVYDPLGMVTPYLLVAKVLMRKMSLDETPNAKISWDEPLSEDMKQKWLDFFNDLYKLENLRIPRCINPLQAVGSPVLVLFSDASNLAYGACAYIRWKLMNEEYTSRLIMAKNRISPIKQLTIPRLELCAAVLSCRLRETIVNGMDIAFCRILHLVDSAIVRAQIQKESHGFGSFVANRISEIQTKTQTSDWHWIPTECNPADMTTRTSVPDQLTCDSIWQKGPEFLSKPIDSWPLKQDDLPTKDLPDTLNRHNNIEISSITTNSRSFLDDIDLKRFPSLRKLFRVTGIMLLIASKRSFNGILRHLDASTLQDAEKHWILHAQKHLPKDTMYRFRRLGPEKTSEGIITVGQRMSEWLSKSWNGSSFALIPKGELAELIVKSFHEEDHSGIDVTLAKIRSQYWIPGVKRVIQRLKSKCVVCRRKDKTRINQQMGRIPDFRLNPCPPFYYSAVDLFGPFTIKDTVKRRTHGKCYGVLFNCLTTRAVYVDLAEGYDVSSFLMALRRFVSIRGYPRTMLSDAGTQLVAAGKELRSIVHSWNWESIKDFGKDKGMDWKTTKSADAPWENGCSESLIKSVKKSLEVSIGNSVMTFSELQTVFFEVSNLLNERPIGTKNCDPNEGTYLCPNDLLLGRASTRVPTGLYENNAGLRIRWKFVQNVVNTFWRRWTRDYFHTLIIRQKWHTTERNVRKGDIVLVQDSNAVRGQWRLAEVHEAKPGSDGRVRDVRLRYKNCNNANYYRGCRDTIICRSVRRLVILIPVEEQL